MGDFEEITELSGVRATCAALLKMELDYYRPRFVWTHSWFAKELIKLIQADFGKMGSQIDSRLPVVIRSRFFDGQWDHSSETRFLKEMKQSWSSPT